MANTATPLTVLPVAPGYRYIKAIKPVAFVIDTIDEDLTLLTATAGYMPVILTLGWAIASAHVIQFTFGAQQHGKYAVAANGNPNNSMPTGLKLTGPAGSIVKIQSSVVIPAGLIYIAEMAEIGPLEGFGDVVK